MRPVRRSFWTLLLLCSLAAGAIVPTPKLRIFLVGDSTMADKPLVDDPERGWGQVVPWFFDDSVVVFNHARNGRSTRSFLLEGRWNTVVGQLLPGDEVFIQFGHNDAKADDTSRYAAPHTDYRQNLRRFVADVRAKGAVPVLITPVNRRAFDSAGGFVDRHGDYPAVVREVAREERVPLIDLHAASLKRFQQLGAEGTKALFLWVPPGSFAAIPDGKQDNTHFTMRGALEVAGMVVRGIRELGLPCASHLRPESDLRFPGVGKRVILDEWFNCETHRNPGGTMEQFHYTWEDTANSGFSALGRAIVRLGADITSLHREPREEDLSLTGIYVIVDPDTPQESPDPHFISDAAAERIANWVHAGGTLVLMANDSGNVEFTHFNRLAAAFGIRFNEDSFHRVVGRSFDMGKFDRLPDYPVFEHVGEIYMKEICSISLTPPARPVLTEGGRVFIASSEFGAGFVVAVGDPWLYNEYFDGRKLPPEYQNDRAGANLFRWLLERRTVPAHRSCMDPQQ